jgi:hypothetical protein
VWKSPALCVYDWSGWSGLLIRSVWPKSRRIEAKFREAPHEIAARLPRKTKLLLIHLDISVMLPFIPDAPALIDVLFKRNVRVLNCMAPDIRKRTIQSRCRDFGLPTVTAPVTGPDDELLIVKTDLNSGGERELLLSPAQRAECGLAAHPGRMKHPDDYFVGRRGDLTADIWNDPTLVVERYIKNPLDRFFRVYVVVNAVVISEAYTDAHVKRMAGRIRRHNHWLWREGQTLYADSDAVAKLPSRLLHTAGIFLNRFQLDYGAIDVVEGQDGEFFVVDVNKTPYWGDEKQPGLTEHLRLGFSRSMQD